MKYKMGSGKFDINVPEIQSVIRGFIIAIGGTIATVITQQLTGADFTIRWHEFNIGAFYFAAGSYNASMIIWATWSALINFARKYIADNSNKPI